MDLDKLKVRELLNSNNLIEEYVISKRYPSSLEIKIIETELLALLNRKGKSFYIGSNGKLIEAEDMVKNLPYIFGDPNIDKFLSLKRIIDSSKLEYNDVKNLFFFPSGRWDIETSSGVLIKLPIENIEVIENININKENLYRIDLKNLFKEYENKNLALVLITDTSPNDQKIFIRTRILNKKIDKTIIVKKNNKNTGKANEEIVKAISEELINVIKSQNLIDVRTPSFLNARLITNKKNNLVELNKRLQNIDTVDGIFVQEFNNKYVLLKIRYLGKLDKIINELKQQNIMLEFINDQWKLKIKK